MMALTGHTGKIGSIILNHYNCVKGFSRSNGYDIRSEQDRIIEESKSCNVFINCAHGGPGFAQTELFWKIFNEWINTNKIIINIGSEKADYNIWSKIRKGYCSEKSALAAAVEEAQTQQHKCKVSIINPYIVNKCVQKDLITAIDFCINSNSEIKLINLQ